VTAPKGGIAAVREVVARHAGLSVGEVHDDAALADLGVGSFTLMRILADVQELFGVELTADDVVAAMDGDVAGLHRLALQAQER
jgi:acyl carrier protein